MHSLRNTELEQWFLGSGCTVEPLGAFKKKKKIQMPRPYPRPITEESLKEWDSGIGILKTLQVNCNVQLRLIRTTR